MNLNTTFIQSAFFLIIQEVTSTHAQCNSSAIGYALVGHVYKNISAPSPLECYEKCKKEEPKCRSFNFHEDKTTCELNSHSNKTRPADFKYSERSVYFHSCYRARLGSKTSIAANNCAEIISHEDSLGDGWYWLRTGNSQNETARIFCNMANAGKMDSSFDLIFPKDRNISNYVMIDALAGHSQLSQLTVSLWLRTTEKVLVPISYATSGEANSILLFMDETGVLRFIVNSESVHGYTGTLDDNRWHHVAATWENTAGLAQVFIDGDLKITKTAVHVNSHIAAGGKLVLGLDQDELGGGFKVAQSFAGELTHVYLWDTALELQVVTQMAHVCRELPQPGHVVGWTDFSTNIHGEVARRNYSRCNKGIEEDESSRNVFCDL